MIQKQKLAKFYREIIEERAPGTMSAESRIFVAWVCDTIAEAMAEHSEKMSRDGTAPDRMRAAVEELKKEHDGVIVLFKKGEDA